MTTNAPERERLTEDARENYTCAACHDTGSVYDDYETPQPCTACEAGVADSVADLLREQDEEREVAEGSRGCHGEAWGI